MFRISTKETYQDGEIIFTENSTGEAIYMVQAGAVEISKEGEGVKVVLEVVEPGGVFGELGFIAKMPRSGTARALGQTTVGIVDRSSLDQEINSLSPGFLRILDSLARRLLKTTEIAVQGQRRRQHKILGRLLSYFSPSSRT